MRFRTHSPKSSVDSKISIAALVEANDGNGGSSSLHIAYTAPPHQSNGGDELPKRLDPSRKDKVSSLLRSSFTRKKFTKVNMSNHSSHHDQLSNDIIKSENNNNFIRNKTDHGKESTDLIQADFGLGIPAADVKRLLQASTLDGELVPDTSDVSRIDEEKYTDRDHRFCPPPSDRIEKHSSTCSSKSGEESVTEINEKSIHPSFLSSSTCGESVIESSNDLDFRLEKVMNSIAMLSSLGDSPSSHQLDNIAAIRAEEYIKEFPWLEREKWNSTPQFTKADLVVGQFLGKGTFSDVFEVFATATEEEQATLESLDEDRAYLEKLIKTKFGSTTGVEHLDKSTGSEGDDLDKKIDAMFGPTAVKRGSTIISRQEDTKQQRLHRSETRRQIRFSRHRSSAVPQHKNHQERKGMLAMKCLRPQIRSDAEQFIIGVEDLLHETLLLASLDHPNIIKLRGRSGECISNSFRLRDGFFILLDRLTDTLEDRIIRWKKTSKVREPPALSQVKTACSLAEAMSYLHDKMILFRDLKPANVGFDASGVLKLFDFGFAIHVEPPGKSGDSEESHLLYDRCGTPRYMAPEVALEMGYSFPADVYSFGILLWEICALKKPFDHVKSADELHKAVFVQGARPKLGKYWPKVLRDILTSCWLSPANDRPTMPYIKTILSACAREASSHQNDGQKNMRNSSEIRRFSGY